MTLTLELRSVRDQDCRLLWEWVNEPGVRTAAFHSQPITWEEHVAWFRGKQGSLECWMYLVLDEADCPVGQVRFDRIGHRCAEIDISVTQDRRGQGIGSTVLRLACEQLPRITDIRQVVARIKAENLMSIRVFEKAGFSRVSQPSTRDSVELRWSQ